MIKRTVFNFVLAQQLLSIFAHPDLQDCKNLDNGQSSNNPIFKVVYDRNHLFGLGSDIETETENWPKLLADTETNRNQKILNWKALYQGVCKNSFYRHSCR